MYKHVAKQRKLASKNKQVTLSDESDSSDDEARQPTARKQLRGAKDDDDSASGSEDGSNSEEDSEDEDGDQEMLGVDAEEEGSEDESEEQAELAPPPPGYPTVAQALKDPIAYPPSTSDDGEDGEPVCVVCSGKALKKGKMLEVHLASKGHERRLKRFTSHCSEPSFPESSLLVDARSISAQIDNIVLASLSSQTQFGASAKVTPTHIAELEAKSTAEEGAGSAKLRAAVERRSVRAVLREEKLAQNLLKRSKKKEKKARLAVESEKDGTTTDSKIKQGGKVKKVDVKPSADGVRGKRRKEDRKPTPEEIAARQAAKKAKREAVASTASVGDAPTTVQTPTESTTGSKKPKKEKSVTSEKLTVTKKSDISTKEGAKASGKKEKSTKSKTMLG